MEIKGKGRREMREIGDKQDKEEERNKQERIEGGKEGERK